MSTKDWSIEVLNINVCKHQVYVSYSLIYPKNPTHLIHNFPMTYKNHVSINVMLSYDTYKPWIYQEYLTPNIDWMVTKTSFSKIDVIKQISQPSV